MEYWKDISEKQEKSAWGSRFIEQVAIDLKNEFPEMKGFSRRNLYAIRQWYKLYSSNYAIVPQVVVQIPLGHNRLIISKIKNIEEAIFYSTETAQKGWNRDTLEIQIENKHFERQGKAINNFTESLPLDQSEIASKTLKDPYNFDFLGL